MQHWSIPPKLNDTNFIINCEIIYLGKDQVGTFRMLLKYEKYLKSTLIQGFLAVSSKHVAMARC